MCGVTCSAGGWGSQGWIAGRTRSCDLWEERRRRREEDHNREEMGRFPLEIQEVGVGYRCGSAFYRLESGTPCPGSALAGTLGIEDQSIGGCVLNLLHSPWSRTHCPLPQGTQEYGERTDGTGASPQVGESTIYLSCPSGVARGCL